MKGLNLTKLSMCIDINEMNVGIVMCEKISQIYNQVMVSRQNLVLALYLKNKWMEFNRILPTL